MGRALLQYRLLLDRVADWSDIRLAVSHMAMLGFGITGYSENKSLLTQHKNEVGGRSSFDD
jgi:hypothetical protein